MNERMVVRRNIIDIEAAERDLRLKLYRKASFICIKSFYGHVSTVLKI